MGQVYLYFFCIKAIKPYLFRLQDIVFSPLPPKKKKKNEKEKSLCSEKSKYKHDYYNINMITNRLQAQETFYSKNLHCFSVQQHSLHFYDLDLEAYLEISTLIWNVTRNVAENLEAIYKSVDWGLNRKKQMTVNKMIYVWSQEMNLMKLEWVALHDF